MTEFNFSNCNKNGHQGPTQEEADSAYLDTSVRVEIIKGTQKWRVPKKGVYTIEAAGASGFGNSSYKSGKGAVYTSSFSLEKHDVLYIVVGQQGVVPNANWGGSGGGASYIAKLVPYSSYYFEIDKAYVTPLLIAAGGGGGGSDSFSQHESQKDGFDGLCETSEEGGGSNKTTRASGGAGFVSNSKSDKAKSFLNGSVSSYFRWNGAIGCGGFGGGGCPHKAGGGGGGYKGGDSLETGQPAYGGYSFNSGKNISCYSGKNEGPGYVRIKLIKLATYSNHASRKSNLFYRILL
jgi:anaplastic lymphoma kinase